MAQLACAGCSTVYSVGAPRCPHCGSTDHYEEGQAMPKITVHGGATNDAEPALADLPDDEPTTAPEEESSPGNSSETSPEKPPSSEKPNAKQARSRARTTENPS